jgi:hypothetical protein
VGLGPGHFEGFVVGRGLAGRALGDLPGKTLESLAIRLEHGDAAPALHTGPELVLVAACLRKGECRVEALPVYGEQMLANDLGLRPGRERLEVGAPLVVRALACGHSPTVPRGTDRRAEPQPCASGASWLVVGRGGEVCTCERSTCVRAAAKAGSSEGQVPGRGVARSAA